MFSALYWSFPAGPDNPAQEQIKITAEARLYQHLQNCRRQLVAGHLRRARGYYLYFDYFAMLPEQQAAGQLKGQNTEASLKKGGQLLRFCDLYLDAGQALSGHRPLNVNKRLKNTMSRGLSAALPHGRSSRLLPLLRRLFPSSSGTSGISGVNGEQDFRLYHSLNVLREQLGARPFSLSRLLSERQSAGVALWRPLARPAAAEQPSRLLLPVLGSTIPLPYLLLNATACLPPSDVCSPLQMEALILALGQCEQLLHQGDQGEAGLRAAPLERLRRVIGQNTGDWEQDGIYLYWQGRDGAGYDRYAQLWQQGFDQGLLLPPHPWAPLILPPALLRPERPERLSSEGQKLQKLLGI